MPDNKEIVVASTPLYDDETETETIVLVGDQLVIRETDADGATAERHVDDQLVAAVLTDPGYTLTDEGCQALVGRLTEPVTLYLPSKLMEIVRFDAEDRERTINQWFLEAVHYMMGDDLDQEVDTDEVDDEGEEE